MKAAPDPVDENARVEALRRYRILDSGNEPAFDELATLAAQICGCSIALITLGDQDRQWFKSAVGVNLREPSREVSFCARTLLGEGVAVVNDMLADERFRDNPLVLGEPGIRFYAGVPVTTPEGHRIGALCVLDRVPRELTPSQMDALRTLSRQIVSLLELRRRLLEEKEQTQTALSESRQFTREIIESAAEGIIVYDRSLRYVTWNASMERLTGMKAPEVIGKKALELFPHLRSTGVAALLERALAGETVTSPDIPYRVPATGLAGWVVGSYSPHRNARGEIVGVIGLLRDISARKAAEEAPRKNEERFRAMLEHSSDAIKIFDAEGHILYTGPSTRPILGYSEQEIIGRDGFELIHPEDLPEAKRVFGQLLSRSRASVHLEMRLRHRDGSWRWLNCVATNLLDEPSIAGVVVNYRDVTEHRRNEETVRRSEEKYRTIFDFAPIGIYQSDPAGVILAANPALARLLGYESVEELSRRRMQDLYFRQEDRESLIARYGPAGSAHDIEVLWKKKDGTSVWVQLTVQDIQGAREGIPHYEGFVRDITSQKTLEEQLRQSHKMEAVGRLAGGIAHDFNNLLTAVLGYSDIALAQIEEGHPLRQEIEEIRRAGQRAANLTGQLLAFSRRQILIPEVLDLNSVIANLGAMLRRLIGEDMDLQLRLDPGLGRMRADLGQIEQVIVNLVVNAREAMPRGGRLTLETANVDLAEEDVRLLGRFFKTGSYIRLTVRDTGMGMDAVTRLHIFEPFFTTKERSKGTGLGLATVYGIIKQSEGYILVDSEPDQGAVFRCYFPRVAGELAVAAPLSRQVPARRGNETVLLVEDEDAVRGLARRILQQHGYDVLEASAGDEAMRIAAGHSGPIDLLLSDVVMPGMSGRALADRIKPLRPETKVLLMSGYTDDAILQHGALDEDTAFLAKPFTPDGLLQRLREVLETRSRQ